MHPTTSDPLMALQPLDIPVPPMLSEALGTGAKPVSSLYTGRPMAMRPGFLMGVCLTMAAGSHIRDSRSIPPSNRRWPLSTWATATRSPGIGSSSTGSLKEPTSARCQRCWYSWPVNGHVTPPSEPIRIESLDEFLAGFVEVRRTRVAQEDVQEALAQEAKQVDVLVRWLDNSWSA